MFLHGGIEIFIGELKTSIIFLLSLLARTSERSLVIQ